MKLLKPIVFFIFLQQMGFSARCQETFPVNGVADKRTHCYALTNAEIVIDAKNKLSNGTLIIKEGKIVAVGIKPQIPAEAVIIDCKGKHIYPSFIDIYSDYGMPPLKPATNINFFAPAQITSNTKGAFGWNQAIKTEINAAELFNIDEAKAKTLRDIGFGVVLTHQKDGIARGTGTVVSLANNKENLLVIREKASAHYSFSRGSSTQSYPQSLMGSIALLRQTFLDGNWYKKGGSGEGANLSLQAWNNNMKLPQIFESNDKWNCLRADRIGDEFSVQYILKAGGNEYQRMAEMVDTKASFILPLNFPQAMDVEDPNDSRFVALAELKNWEMAPTNPAAFEKANVNFCITTADLKDNKQFFTNLRKAIEYGLSEGKALEALTKTPAMLLNIYNETGSLEVGKIANFIITNGPIFQDKTTLLENWVQGIKYAIKEDVTKNIAGSYSLTINTEEGNKNYVLELKNNKQATVMFGKDSLRTSFNSDGKMVNLNFSLDINLGKKTPNNNVVNILKADTSKLKINDIAVIPSQRDSLETPDDKLPKQTIKPSNQLPSNNTAISKTTIPTPYIRLSGILSDTYFQGNGVDTLGKALLWSAILIKAVSPKQDSVRKKPIPQMGKLTYPNMAYGWEQKPKQENILIKNTTVWTNENEGILYNTDVLVQNGKIAAIGKNLSNSSAKIIDGNSLHLTPGIIDEHSHIACASINEGGQTVTSEVRIGDNLYPDDINIYRQLSGGVTSSHILHGSANTIGGQTQLIKLRWGANDTALKFKGADGFIKFALGENVKRTPAQVNNRFPDSRMGVEQVQMDAFTRAKDYENALKGANAKLVRRDLELDALVEILNKKRFITCHSYVASEIIETMRMAEHFGFKINTFTHILEGYKVADKMKAHGAQASTFSDWWAYKVEVQDAIPYNPAIMQKLGLNVAINSDDPEMARRLNQEAAKSIKYGGLSETDALKMVTLNPAIMLHIDKTVGSIKVGKDADLVLWSDNPLSMYAIAEKTMVDGIIYFDRIMDNQLRVQIASERNRLIQKMIGEKKSGNSVIQATTSFRHINDCGDHGDD